MISVVIPLWNKEKYIARTLQSILAQTYTLFEVIVVDDGSTDHSANIVRQFNDKRIRLIQQTNQGVSAARNRGIEEARYPYVAFIDADDEWLPEHLKTLEHLISNYPECKFYSTCYWLQINQNTPTVPNILFNRLPFKKEGIMDNYFEIATGINAPLNMSTIAVERTLLQKIGGFPLNIPSGEDIITFARLNNLTNIAYSTQITSIIHLIYTGKNERPIQNYDILDQWFDNLIKEASHKKGVKRFVAFWHKQQMVRAIYQKKYMLASKHALHSLAIRPLQYKIITSFLLTLYSTISNTDLYSFQQKINSLFKPNKNNKTSL